MLKRALVLGCLALTPTPAFSCPMFEYDWVRHEGGPVLRDQIVNEQYEAASDPHVFLDDEGRKLMIYSGDDQDEIAIKLAYGHSWTEWQILGTLLGKSQGHDLPVSKETAFYFKAPNGQHQIYFIGYNDQENYDAEVYLAQASAVNGPYVIKPEPVVPRGLLAGKQVEVITSPSVVEHEGTLYMSFLAWDAFQDVSEVWVLGAVSHDNGESWGDYREVTVPIGMEGQITKLADGSFVAVRTWEHEGEEAIMIACADHPFGPYEEREEPILEMMPGDPFETDELIAAQITIDPATGKPLLYYAGAIHAAGWWIMQARGER
ncbi:MAG: hypothetical protein KI792_11645 [Alphaproteobacteria bacterium]|nr:hypothetical protein [Alphaproteobacteria bacterium SS10]